MDPEAGRIMRTAAWYGDTPVALRMPDDWDVQTYWPSTPRPLSDPEAGRPLESPLGQAPLRELARGARRPVIVVDDLTRPTPASVVLPPLIRQLEQAGISRDRLTIVVASGTHGPPPHDSIARKIGRDVMRSVTTVGHDDRRDIVATGRRTSFGTPIDVNRRIAESDFIVGVGGVYPQHSTGFGGGSKLLLGVLGRRSITHLHFGRKGAGGTHDVNNDFRRDLDEIATTFPLRTLVSLHVDAARQIVRAFAGTPAAVYSAAVEFARSAYGAPHPGDADVVISNAFPSDVSLTFVNSKGLLPLFAAAPGASRIVIASCPEGLGHHGLYPYGSDIPRLHRVQRVARQLSVLEPREKMQLLWHLGSRRIRGLKARTRPFAARAARRPIYLYPPSGRRPVPGPVAGMTVVEDWQELIARVRDEHERRPLRVAVYPCAPLQVLAAGPETSPAGDLDLVPGD